MPTTGLPFRVFFFWFGSVAWFDQDATGGRVFGSGSLEQVWPDVASMMVADHGDQAPIDRAYPVSPTVLRLSRRSNRHSEIAVHVDVLRGVAVPSPTDALAIVSGYRQVISWDPGPVVMTLDPAGQNLQLIDLRTGLRGPEAPFGWSNPDFPILAIPGEPVRRFWKTVPPQVESRAADGSQVMQNLSDVFPRLPLSGVDAATVMYGDFRRPAVSQLTAELDDGDLAVLASAAQIVGDDGPRLLAVLSILTGVAGRLPPGRPLRHRPHDGAAAGRRRVGRTTGGDHPSRCRAPVRDPRSVPRHARSDVDGSGRQAARRARHGPARRQ